MRSDVEAGQAWCYNSVLEHKGLFFVIKRNSLYSSFALMALDDVFYRCGEVHNFSLDSDSWSCVA